MIWFFMLNVVGGFLKYVDAKLKDAVEWYDIAALIYSVLVFIAMVVYWAITGEVAPV